MVLRFFILASVFFFISCGDIERDHPDDPGGTNYGGGSLIPGLSSPSAKPSSSSAPGLLSSSSNLVSSGPVPGLPSSSSNSIQSGVVYGDDVIYEDETYKTVVIGSKTWFQRNLNYAADNSICADCATYGRLYDWATAMALDASCNTSSCASQITTPHQGICPDGWHIPSDADWDALMTAVGGSSTAGTKLKANSDLWNNNGKGTDNFGFSALPGGYVDYDGSFNYVGNYGFWWSASEGSSYNAYGRGMYYYDELVYYNNSNKFTLRSVRCLQD